MSVTGQKSEKDTRALNNDGDRKLPDDKMPSKTMKRQSS